MKNSMQKAIDYLTDEYLWLQIWRATRWLVQHIRIDVYGNSMTIDKIANITTPDSHSIKIEPRDKSSISAIEKWIYESNIWLTPRNDWWYIMVNIPPLTTERRKDTVKQVYKMSEDIKARIRQIRQDEMKNIKVSFEKKEISEDDKKSQEQEIEKITKNFNTEVDNLAKNKDKEIMEI